MVEFSEKEKRIMQDIGMSILATTSSYGVQSVFSPNVFSIKQGAATPEQIAAIKKGLWLSFAANGALAAGLGITFGAVLGKRGLIPALFSAGTGTALFLISNKLIHDVETAQKLAGEIQPPPAVKQKPKPKPKEDDSDSGEEDIEYVGSVPGSRLPAPFPPVNAPIYRGSPSPPPAGSNTIPVVIPHEDEPPIVTTPPHEQPPVIIPPKPKPAPVPVPKPVEQPPKPKEPKEPKEKEKQPPGQEKEKPRPAEHHEAEHDHPDHPDHPANQEPPKGPLYKTPPPVEVKPPAPIPIVVPDPDRPKIPPGQAKDKDKPKEKEKEKEKAKEEKPAKKQVVATPPGKKKGFAPSAVLEEDEFIKLPGSKKAA